MVNLSDIYAMNANATQVTVSIAVSNRFSLEALEELSTRKAAKKVVDDDYSLKWDEIRKCYPC